MNLTPYFKSIIDQDTASVVICNLAHEIIYMNPQAIANYHKWGGEGADRKSLMNCHNPKSKEGDRGKSSPGLAKSKNTTASTLSIMKSKRKTYT